MVSKTWVKIGRISEREYRANLHGLNIFFGAVLGFVMAGTETLDTFRFAYVLMMLSGVIISILYISASKHRLAYAALTAAFVAFLPAVIEPTLGEGAVLPPKLQPTLAVWTLMTMFVEFYPREKHTPEVD
jgi:hypothetical protein